MIDRARHFKGEVRAEGLALTHREEAYHIALEVKFTQKGEPGTGGRGAIEEAVTQVPRGANGFISFLASKPSLVPENTESLILPAVFTTANLWVTDAKLDEASVADGKIDFTGTTVKKVPWLVYQHFQSPELRHDVAGSRVDQSVSRILEIDYMRSVAIISAGSIADFLTMEFGVCRLDPADLQSNNALTSGVPPKAPELPRRSLVLGSDLRRNLIAVSPHGNAHCTKRMQPTGRTSAGLCPGGTSRERAVERRFARAAA